MDNTQFFKIMLVGVFAGILLGNLLYYLIRTFDSRSDDIAEKENDMNENRESKNFKTIQEFNFSNTIAVKINYDIKMHLREIYKRFGFNENQRCELELGYDNESYKIVSILQQGIFKKNDSIDIANKIFDIMRESNMMILLPDELKRIIDINLEKRNG